MQHPRDFASGIGCLAIVLSAATPAAAQCPTATEVSLQASLDRAAASGGGTVQLPPGVYETCQALILRSNVHLKGAGRGATIIQGSAAITGKIVDGAYIGSTIGGAGVSNVSVSDLTVDHRTRGRNANGISFVPTGVNYDGIVPSDIVIEHVEVLGAPGGFHNYMIWNFKGRHVRIRENRVQGGYSIPIDTDAGQEGIESFGGYDVVISDNTVEGVGDACINLGSAGIPQSETVGLTIAQNYLFGCGVGINIGTSSALGGQNNVDTRIAGNFIIYAARAGITVPIADATVERTLMISDNTIRVVGPAWDAVGIALTALGRVNTGLISLVDNHIDRVTGNNASGIRISVVPNVRVIDNTLTNISGEAVLAYWSDDLEVSGNRIERSGSYGIYVGPTAQRTVLSGNLIADWPGGSPGMLLIGIRHGSVSRNVFRRSDASSSTGAVIAAGCSVQADGNQALYPGLAIAGGTGPCQ